MLVAVLLAGCGGAERRAPARTAAGTLRLGVLGDSYSNGQSAGPDAAWPLVLARLLTVDGLPTEVVANPSVTGATTAEMLDRGLEPLRRARPDVMTVMLGVNDQVRGVAPRDYARDIDRALAAAVAITGSPSRVLAVDIPDYGVAPAGARFGDPAATARAIDAFNRTLRAVAVRRRVTVASVVAISRAEGASGISGDGLHPSAAQLSRWARQIEPTALAAWRPLRRQS